MSFERVVLKVYCEHAACCVEARLDFLTSLVELADCVYPDNRRVRKRRDLLAKRLLEVNAALLCQDL